MLSSKTLYILSGISIVSGIVLSNVGTYLLTKQKLQAKYDAEFETRLKFEVEQTKAYYSRLNKRGEFSDPTKLIAEYEEEVSVLEYATDAPDDEPYVISKEVYMENEKGYDQDTITYFEGDDILAGTDDRPMQDMDSLIGLGNLSRFGEQSHDNHVVYIRNDELTVEFEVLLNKGSYAKEVLGFVEHSEPRGRPRKFRRDDE